MSVRRPRRHQVFISYSSKDQATADAVRDHLQANGVSCWMAPHDILGGSDWAAAIVEAIDSSQALLLLLSQASNVSEDVKREVGRAASKNVPIVPFFIENVALSKHMEYFLATTHWLGADTRHIELRMGHLLETVRGLLRTPATGSGKQALAAASPPPAPGPAAPPAGLQADSPLPPTPTPSPLTPESLAAALRSDALAGDLAGYETTVLNALRPMLRFPVESPAVRPGPKPMLAAFAALIIGALGVLFNLQGLLAALAPGASPESFVFAMFPMVRLTAIASTVASAAGSLGLLVGGHRMYLGTGDGPGITMAAARWLVRVLVVWFVATLVFALTTGPAPVRGAVLNATLTTAVLAAIQIGIVWKLTAAVRQ